LWNAESAASCIAAKFIRRWQSWVDGVEKGLVIFGEQ
jgi:hypothetical protein